MKKKQLQERLAALRNEEGAQLDRLTQTETALVGEELSAYNARREQIKQLNDEIAGLEALENAARERAAGQGRTALAEVHNRAEDKPFYNFGEYLQSVAMSSSPGASVDPRLLKFAPSGANESVPSEGGFLVAPEYGNLIYNRGFELASFASNAFRVPLTTSSRFIAPGIDETSRATGSRWGGVRVYRRNESDTVTAQKPKLFELSMTLESLMGLFYATDELLADAGAMSTIATQAFSEEFAFRLDDECLRGNGSGQMLGVLNSACLVTITKESGQASGTILWENIVKMWSRMPGRLRSNARWFINQDVEPQLFQMVQVIGTGGVPVYLPPAAGSQQPYSTLLGRPVVPIEQCSTVGTVGDIILAAPNQYLIIEKGGMQQDQSMHVRFIYAEQTFRFMMRNNGMPIWKSAVTPYKGSNTVSPFVTLEAR